MMNRRQLDYFVHVAKLGSVSEAARVLHISQPAISKCISALEGELQTQLFVRGSKGLQLTDAGLILLQSAERILFEFAASAARIEALASGKKAALRVGLSPILTTSFLTAMVDAFAAQFSVFELSVTGDLAIFDKLRAGELDIALGDIPNRRDLNWCELEHLFVPRAHLVVRKGHPLARRRRLSLGDLSDERWIWPFSDMGPAKLLVDLFRAHGADLPGCRLRVHSRAMTNRLVQEQDFVALLTDHPACRDESWSKLHILPIALPAPPWSIAILSRKGATETREQAVFREIVRTLVHAAERGGA